MQKRGLKIGTYDTAAELWLLAELELTAPEVVTNYVDVPGRRKGPLDLSATLTDGDPVYSTRTLSATFESSEGSRTEREGRIENMMNQLHGQRVNIVLPDDPQRFLVGRIQVEREYNTPAHASVRLTAVCEPWRYSAAETAVTMQAETAQKSGILHNRGRLAVVPDLKITGGDVLITVGTTSETFGTGQYTRPWLWLPPGGLALKYSGAGTLTFTYREAVL